MDQDRQHLQLLAIFHYIMGALVLLFSLFPVIYIVMGAVFLVEPPPSSNPNDPPPELFGGMFIAIGVIGTLMIAGAGVAQFLVARGLNKRKWWIFCIVMSGLNCMNAPFGTALGVFTIVVLLRPSVKHLFGQS